MSDTVYTIKSGDTLSAIANRYGVSGGYMAIAKYNGITNPNIISVGQQIRIPGTSTSASSTSSSGGSIGVGSTVKITGSRYATGQVIPGWVKQGTYHVSQINGQKALIKEIYSWVNLSDLSLVGGGVQQPPQQQPQTQQPEQKNENSKPADQTADEKTEYDQAVDKLSQYPGGKLSTGEFVSMFGPIAREDNRATGVPASVTLAQAALETGWGGSSIGDAKNLFGIKGKGPAGTTVSETKEFVNGQFITIKDGFRRYNTWLESIKDHSDFLLTNSRYANAFNYSDDPDQFAREIHKAGYATDPDYAKKLIQLMNSYGMKAYNVSSKKSDDKKEEEDKSGEKDIASPVITSRVDFGSKNSNPRQNKVSKITIHHMAGNMGATACANMHKNGSCSANYYIGSSGEICAGVAENRRAWTSSNGTNDHQAITFEVANNSGAPNWTISDAAYNSMIALCRDICNRYGITPHFDGTPAGSLTAHYMFTGTECPGPYIKERLRNGQIENDIKGGGLKKQDDKKDDNNNNNNQGGSSEQVYVVKSGDSLSKIASMFNVSGGYQALAAYNGIANPNIISVGQRIRIPGSSSASTQVSNGGQKTGGEQAGAGTGTGTVGSTAGAVVGSSHAPLCPQNIRPIYDYLMNNVFAGRSNAKALACGFLGNMYTESHYDPGAEQAYGQNRLAKGLVQWDGSRRQNLFDYCGGAYNQRDKWADLGKQLNFLKYEIEGSETWSMNPTYKGRTIDGVEYGVPDNSVAGVRKAAFLIARNFERCANPYNEERQNKAEENFKNL